MEQERSQRKVRVETGFRNTISKDGKSSPHIGKEVTRRAKEYCERMNTNYSKFVENCINAWLDVHEREALESMDKRELVDIILKIRS